MIFKLWNKKTRNWDTFSSIETLLKGSYILGDPNPFECMLCSGFVDKNDVEIVQGHVVTHPNWGTTPHLIDFIHGSLIICIIQEEPFSPLGVAFLGLEITINMEVIGHILEDPGLLYLKQGDESQQRLERTTSVDDPVDF